MTDPTARRPLSQSARDRLRVQAKREEALAARVLAAEARLARQYDRRNDAIAAQDRLVAARVDEVADAVIAYIEADGVNLDRAALILSRSKTELTRMIRGRRHTAKPGPRTSE